MTLKKKKEEEKEAEEKSGSEAGIRTKGIEKLTIREKKNSGGHSLLK